MKYFSLLTAAIMFPALGFGMTFDELSTAAYEQSLQKSQIEGNLKSLMYEKESLNAYEPLTLEGSARKIRADERAGDGMEYGFMVGYTALNPRVREAQNAKMDAEAQVIRGSSQLQKGLIRVGLKREYLLGELSKDALEITERKKSLAEEAYAIALKKHQAGRISQMELVRFETERSVAEKEYREWETQIRKHQDILREQTLIEQAIVLDDLSFEYLRNQNIDEAVRKSPVLTGLELAQEELDRSIEILRRSTVESVTIGVGMTQEPTQNSLDVRLSVPLSLSNKNEKKIAALMAQRSSLIHQRALAEQKLKTGITLLMGRLTRIRSAIEDSSNVEKRHEALYQMAKKGFDGGVIGLFEYLETKNRFYASKIETLRLKQEYVQEIAAMEEKMGGTWE